MIVRKISTNRCSTTNDDHRPKIPSTEAPLSPRESAYRDDIFATAQLLLLLHFVSMFQRDYAC